MAREPLVRVAAGASLSLGAGSVFSMANDGGVGLLTLGQQDSFVGAGLTIGSANNADPRVRRFLTLVR